jgi:O-antigen/teichoic acid export membrane protein
MLKVTGRLRYLMAINTATAVLNVALCAALIPAHGAIGAALATTGTLVGHNALKQAGLRRAAGIAPLEARHVGTYAGIVAVTVVLSLYAAATSAGLLVDLGVVAVASAVLLVANRRRLAIERHFPEVGRLPFLGRLLLGSGSGRTRR